MKTHNTGKNTGAKKVLQLAIVLGAFTAQKSFGQASILWSNTASATWQTNTNWTGNTVPTSTDIAQMGVNPVGTTGVGIDMGGTTNNGTANQAVGAVESTNARIASSTLIGNSSTSANGTLTLLGATVNGIANVIIRNNSIKDLLLQNIQGSGTRTMNIALSNTTDNKIVQDAAGKIILSAPITGTGNTPITVTGLGTATEIDITSTANTFTGTISLFSTETVFTGDGSFGAVPASFTANAVVIDGGRMTTAAPGFVINANRGIQVGNTAGTSISVKGGGSMSTYSGIIADRPSTIGGWAKQGAGGLSLGNSNTYSGVTAINNGTIQLITGNNRLPVNTTVSVGQAASTNVGMLNLNGYNQQVAGLNSTPGTNVSATAKNNVTSAAAATLSLGGAGSYLYGDGTTANSGIITGSVSLVKSGSGLQILGDINTYTGLTIVNSGELRFSPNANETLTMSPVTLNGGTLSTTGITSNKILSFSTLNITNNAVINLESTNAHTLNFAGSSSMAWTAATTLTITGWQGSFITSSGSSGTVGKIFVGSTASDLTTAQLSQIKFFDGTLYYPAVLLSTGELVPFFCYPPFVSQSNNSPLCAGATLSLNPTVTSTTSVTYLWMGPNSFTSNIQTPVIAGTSTAATGVYTLVLTKGCGSFTSTASVTINPLPIVLANTSNTAVCSGQQATVTGGGASTYTWTNAGITDGTGFTPTATAIYSVTGTDANSCVNTATVSIIVNSLPTVSVNSATICAAQPLTLTAGGATTYTWSTAATTGSILVSPSANTGYTVTGATAQGCTATAISQVSVNSLPVIAVNSSTICAGQFATLTASGANTYTWNTTSNSASVSISPAANTIYTVSGTSTLGCVNTATAAVVVNALPSLTVPVITICSGGSGTLTASGANTYTWSTSSNGSTISANPVTTTNYTVTGTSLQGCVNSATSSIIITTSPSITVNSATICIGGSVTLNATGVVTYTWSTNANTATINVNPASTTVYTVTGNASACPVMASNTVAVTVNPLPAVTVNNATICAGTAATLIAGGANTYTWNTNVASASITPSPATATNYTVTATSSLGCVNTATSQVTVITIPTISVNSATICTGSTVTLTASGPLTYTWNTNANTSTISVNPTTSTVYTVSSSNAGCIGTQTAAVTVNALPFILSNSTTVCAGGTASLTASGASTYTWSTNGTGSVITVNPAGNTNYTVTGTSTLGCVNSATTTIVTTPVPSIAVNSASTCAGSSVTLNASGVSTYTWSNGPLTANINVTPASTTVYTVSGKTTGCSVVVTKTVTVTVNALPVISVNSATICAGSSATLIANGALTYFWSTVATGTSIVVTPASTTGYTIAGTDVNGCNNFTTAAVTVNTLPVITVNSATICQGSSAMLTTNGASTYSWNSGATTATLSVNPSSTTVYTVTGTSSQGCIKTAVASVMVNTLPVVSLSLPHPTICVGDAAMILTASPAGGTFAGTGVSSGTFTPSTAGTFTITYSFTDANSCANSSTKVLAVNVCTGVKESAKTNPVVIFPNPVKDKLQIRNPNFSTVYTIDLYDLTGKQVYSASSVQQDAEIDMSSYTQGLYILKITENNTQSFVKFIKD